MRILPQSQSPVDQTSHAKESATARAAAGASKAAAARDDVAVAVSSEAARLADTASVDQAKVDRLRAAVADGTLTIDHQLIAKRILDKG